MGREMERGDSQAEVGKESDDYTVTLWKGQGGRGRGKREGGRVWEREGGRERLGGGRKKREAGGEGQEEGGQHRTTVWLPSQKQRDRSF